MRYEPAGRKPRGSKWVRDGMRMDDEHINPTRKQYLRPMKCGETHNRSLEHVSNKLEVSILYVTAADI